MNMQQSVWSWDNEIKETRNNLHCAFDPNILFISFPTYKLDFTRHFKNIKPGHTITLLTVTQQNDTKGLL